MAFNISIEAAGAGRRRIAIEGDMSARVAGELKRRLEAGLARGAAAAPGAHGADQTRALFLADSRALQQAVLRYLRHHPVDAELIEFVARAARTLRGSAGLFGLDEVAALGDQLDAMVDPARRAELVAQLRAGPAPTGSGTGAGRRRRRPADT